MLFVLYLCYAFMRVIQEVRLRSNDDQLRSAAGRMEGL